MKKILLTGFEPFGGEKINPSLEIIKVLKKEEWKDDLQIYVCQLPVVFGKSIEVLKKAISEIDPDIVIGLGQAGGRTALSIERIAINVNDAKIPDNEKNQPIDEPIMIDKPAAYFTTLPIKKMMKAARDAGVPAIISNTAGTYVCNHIMYGILDLLNGTNKMGGFIHIPYLPEQVVDKPNYPSMSLETMLKGIKAMLFTALRGQEDEAYVGGALD